MPRGGRRSNPGGRPPLPDEERRIPRQVGLSVREFRASHDALEPHEEWPDFVREAIAQHPRTRKAIAEIADMIRGCDISLSTAHGNYADTVKRQRATLEFVLRMLKPAEVKRRELAARRQGSL